MGKKQTKNEAALEARISQVLHSCFPSFKDVKVKHQESFSLKLGHHNISVDNGAPGKYPVRAIFDILLEIDGKPTILLELKREGQTLTDQDRDQGISYARLIHPMPPITMISNGNENQLFNSLTKVRLDSQELDLATIQRLIDSSIQLAANDFKDAVRLLLNKDHRLFSSIVNEISSRKFGRMIGPLVDLSKPICDEFLIERKIVKDAISMFDDNVPMVGIIGGAFSGKTNVLYQFYRYQSHQKNRYAFYLDCKDHNYSILQNLANALSKETSVNVNAEQVREWIRNSLFSDPESRFFLILDDFSNGLSEVVANEIIELIDLFSGANNGVLYSIDAENYRNVAFKKDRHHATLIGSKSKLLFLEELDDEEYNQANSILFNSYRVIVEHGGHFTPEFREPRVLRQVSIPFIGDFDEKKVSRIPPVPNYDLLRHISENKAFPRKYRKMYKRLVDCFITEQSERANIPSLAISAFGTGAVSKTAYKRIFSGYNQLKRSATIDIRILHDGIEAIFPKIPELFSFLSIEPIIKLLLSERENMSRDELTDYFLHLVQPFPYCDIVGTGVLQGLGNRGEIDMFSIIIQSLLGILPAKQELGEGTIVAMHAPGIGEIRLHFEDNMEEGGLISDFLPYAILSQLAGFPLRLEDTSEYSEYAFHMGLIYKVGSVPHFVRRADVRSLKNMKAIDTFELKGVGTIVSGKEGIIEPIVESIKKCFLIIPEEMTQLYHKAFEENNFLLLWRFYLALRSLQDLVDDKIATEAKKFVNIFNPYFNEFFAEQLTKEIEDENERKKMKAKLMNMKDDSPLPPQSQK